MPKFTVTDTITFKRTWRNVEAGTEDEAINLCDSGNLESDAEEQIDNTPYEAEEEAPDYHGVAHAAGYRVSRVDDEAGWRYQDGDVMTGGAASDTEYDTPDEAWRAAFDELRGGA